MSKYIRTNTKSFYDLTARQMVYARELMGEDANQTLWVNCPTDENACLPLCDFERAEKSKIWDGYFGLSYFSGFFIKFDRRNPSCCTVGYRHW